MAKREVIKVVPKDMFLENYYTPQLEDEIVRSSLWPLAVAVYSACNGRGRISQWSANGSFGTRMAFSTPEGFNIGYIATQGCGDSLQYSVYAGDAYFKPTFNGGTNATLNTNNIRYAINKLGKSSNHDIRRGFIRASSPENLNGDIYSKLHSLIDRAVDQFNGGSINCRPTIDVDDHTATMLAQLFMGDMTANDMPSTVTDEVNTKFVEFKEKLTRFNLAIDSSKELFAPNKLLFFTKINNGIVVGKTKTDWIGRMLNNYKNGGTLRMADKAIDVRDMVVPFKWYPSIEALPADLRQELEIQLVMLKAHTGSDSLIPNPEVSYGADIKVWPALDGGAIFSAWESHLLVLNG